MLEENSRLKLNRPWRIEPQNCFQQGGSAEGTNAAVENLDWIEFFVEAPITTAVPISFVARTLNGKKEVVLIDNATFTQQGNCDYPEKLKMKVEIENVTLENPKLGDAQYNSVIFKNNQQVGDVLQNGHFVTIINTGKLDVFGKGGQEYSWEIASSSKDKDRLVIRSANNAVHDNQIFQFPFTEFIEGAQTRHYYATNNRGEIMRFRYRITKTYK